MDLSNELVKRIVCTGATKRIILNPYYKAQPGHHG